MQNFQKGVRVAFQGERGAYSEEAAFLFFGPRIQVVPCKGLPEVFEAVEMGAVDFGVVPIENSLEGSVNETYDLLLGSKLHVSGEINLRVVHCLIASSGTYLSDIKTVYSHPQALAQCRKFFGRSSLRAGSNVRYCRQREDDKGREVDRCGGCCW